MENVVIDKPKIVLFTRAYQAEKTIARAIESVLAQTYTDFTYSIQNNGSTDRTGEIIKEYADRDKRIVFEDRDYNSLEDGHEFRKKHAEGFDYFATLDADDEYEPWFLRDALENMQKYDLDIVYAGFSAYSSSGDLLRIHTIPESIVLDRDSKNDIIISEIDQLVAFLWGNLYKVSFLYMETPESDSMSSAVYAEAIKNYEWFAAAKRVALLSRPSYRYCVNTKSSISKLYHDAYLHKFATCQKYIKSFLQTRVGYISKENEEYLYYFYTNRVRNHLFRILNAEYDIPLIDAAVHSALSEPLTQELIDLYGDRARHDIYGAIGEFFLKLSLPPEKQVEGNIYELYDSLINSTSWRITAPLRKCVDFIRGKKK